jgi:hypothetical protein
VTIEEQAQQLEASYGKFHRQTSQYGRTEEDRREAINTLKRDLREAERTLSLPATSDTASARSKLILWCELTRATIEEGAPRR